MLSLAIPSFNSISMFPISAQFPWRFLNLRQCAKTFGKLSRTLPSLKTCNSLRNSVSSVTRTTTLQRTGNKRKLVTSSRLILGRKSGKRRQIPAGSTAMCTIKWSTQPLVSRRSLRSTSWLWSSKPTSSSGRTTGKTQTQLSYLSWGYLSSSWCWSSGRRTPMAWSSLRRNKCQPTFSTHSCQKVALNKASWAAYSRA